MNSTVSLVIGSAVIGALVSSIITFIGQAIERRARRRELLLSKAIELGQADVKYVLEAFATSGKGAFLVPLIAYTRWYHKELLELYTSNKLTDELEERFAHFIAHGRIATAEAETLMRDE